MIIFLDFDEDRKYMDIGEMVKTKKIGVTWGWFLYLLCIDMRSSL